MCRLKVPNMSAASLHEKNNPFSCSQSKVDGPFFPNSIFIESDEVTEAVTFRKSSYDEEMCDRRLEAWPTQAKRYSFYGNEKNCQQNLRERPHFKIQHVKITITVTSNCYYSKQS